MIFGISAILFVCAKTCLLVGLL